MTLSFQRWNIEQRKGIKIFPIEIKEVSKSYHYAISYDFDENSLDTKELKYFHRQNSTECLKITDINRPCKPRVLGFASPELSSRFKVFGKRAITFRIQTETFNARECSANA